MIFSFILEFCQKYWKQIAIIALGLIIFAFGWYNGYQHEKAKFDAFVLQMQVNAKVQEERNAIILKNQEKITTNVVKGYSDAIKNVNSYYSNSNRVSNSAAGSSMPNNGKTASTTNEQTTNIEDNAARIDATIIPQECVNDAINLFYLQKWINGQVDNQ